jgi:hypothetical protein
MEITTPLMKRYADRIGAEFIEITERKFPEWHIHFEKTQIWELGKDADWNVFFDGDVLVHPDMFDVTKLNSKLVYLKDGYRANIKFRPNKYFIEDKRNQGISSCVIITSKENHKIWTPLNMTPIEVDNEIITTDENRRKGIESSFYQEEYLLSYNLAKYKINYSGMEQGFLFHSYLSNDVKTKIEELKKVSKQWNI